MTQASVSKPGQTRPQVSVIIPAYNEQDRISPTLRTVQAYLDRTDHAIEVIVVDDGSRDETAEVAKRVLGADPRFRVSRLERNSGKGAAIGHGVELARGEWVLYMDADGATPIEELDRLLPVALAGADVVAGSRRLPSSDIQIEQTWMRQLLGTSFALLVRALLGVRVRDTQCGFKLMRADAARAIFSKLTVHSFAFDVELLTLAVRSGYRIEEVPVIWRDRLGSTLSPLRAGPRMLADVLRIAARHGRHR